MKTKFRFDVSEGQKVWIRNINPPNSVWDVELNNFREYRTDETREMVREAYVKKVKKKIHVCGLTGGHMNGPCDFGKFYFDGTQDNGKHPPDYTLHLTKEHAIATVEWHARKPKISQDEQ